MKIYIKIILLILTVVSISSCKKEEAEVYGDVGEITVNTVGAMDVVPATVTFTAQAENAVFYIWNFGYSQDLNDSDNEVKLLPMGAMGDEVEFEFSEPGTYTVTVIAYNGANKTREKEIQVSFFTLEDDLDVTEVDNSNLDLTIDACNPDNSISFSMGFNVTDANGIIDMLTVVREYNSPLYGYYSVTDTVDPSGVVYNYTTQEELLASFDVEETFISDNDEFIYSLYATGNGVTVKIGEVTGTASVTILEAVTLPLGHWIAKNEDTGFTKDIQIERPSPFQSVDDGRYWISDFGLDWSSWWDMWYTVEIKLICPAEGETNYAIDLFGSGTDTGVDRTDIDRFGTVVTKSVRIMPYLYSGTAVGYYNPDTQVITFENVPLTDGWWSADNHTVNLTFTYVGSK